MPRGGRRRGSGRKQGVKVGPYKPRASLLVRTPWSVRLTVDELAQVKAFIASLRRSERAVQMLPGGYEPHMGDMVDTMRRSLLFCARYGYKPPAWLTAWKGGALAPEYRARLQAEYDIACAFMDSSYGAPSHAWGMDIVRGFGLYACQ